jgi:hypothetical protein
MEFTPLVAPPLLAMAAGTVRPLATRVAQGACAVPASLVARGQRAVDAACSVGRVHAGGRWSDPLVHGALAAALPAPLRAALGAEFDWYYCRGAHFHTDAHYAGVLFGVWMVDGPAAEIVFARGGVRRPLAAGRCVLFDPFEVHAVLRPGAADYRAEDYAGTAPTVFVGFELTLTEAVRAAFGIAQAGAAARVIGSGTRVSAATGCFE